VTAEAIKVRDENPNRKIASRRSCGFPILRGGRDVSIDMLTSVCTQSPCKIQVLRTVEKKRDDIEFELQDHLLGGASIDATGTPLTEEALSAAKNADAVILGAVGGPVSCTVHCQFDCHFLPFVPSPSSFDLA